MVVVLNHRTQQITNRTATYRPRPDPKRQPSKQLDKPQHTTIERSYTLNSQALWALWLFAKCGCRWRGCCARGRAMSDRYSHFARASGCVPELLCPPAILWLTLRISQPPTPTTTISTPNPIHTPTHLPCSEKFAIICTTQQQTFAAGSLSDSQPASCCWLMPLTTTHSPQHATDYSDPVKYIKSSIVHCRLMCEDVLRKLRLGKTKEGRCCARWFCGEHVCVWHGVYPSSAASAVGSVNHNRKHIYAAHNSSNNKKSKAYIHPPARPLCSHMLPTTLSHLYWMKSKRVSVSLCWYLLALLGSVYATERDTRHAPGRLRAWW